MENQKAISIVGITLSLFVLTMVPTLAFAEIVSVNTQKTTFNQGDKIIFYGFETDGNQPISLVIRDSSNEFVTLLSTISNKDGQFQTLPITTQDLFTKYGSYTVTAFENDRLENTGKSITMQYSRSYVTSYPQIPTFNYVMVDKGTYERGETIHIFGQFPVFQKNIPATITIKDYRGIVVDRVQIYPDSNGQFSYFVSTDSTKWKFSGQYSVNVQYLNYQTTTSFGLRVLNIQATNDSIPSDEVNPLVLVPEDILAQVSSSEYAKIFFTVSAIDETDGILTPKCSHSPYSEFPIGTTRVTCTATDSAGNSDTKSFDVVVTKKEVFIPSWVRGVAQQWCNNQIDDSNYTEALIYLIENDVISMPHPTIFNVSDGQKIPKWVKDTTCWWSEKLISDREFTSGMNYLISNGIVKV